MCMARRRGRGVLNEPLRSVEIGTMGFLDGGRLCLERVGFIGGVGAQSFRVDGVAWSCVVSVCKR